MKSNFAAVIPCFYIFYSRFSLQQVYSDLHSAATFFGTPGFDSVCVYRLSLNIMNTQELNSFTGIAPADFRHAYCFRQEQKYSDTTHDEPTLWQKKM